MSGLYLLSYRMNLHVYVICVAQVLPDFSLYVEGAHYAEYLSFLHGSKGLIQSVDNAVRPVGPAWQDFCHFFRIRRTRCRCWCADDIIIVMEQFMHHLGIIFIGKDRKEKYPLSVPKYITVSLTERIDTGRVMSSIDNNVCFSGPQDLEPPGPFHMVKALFNSRTGQSLLVTGQEQQRHGGRSAIHTLVFP